MYIVKISTRKRDLTPYIKPNYTHQPRLGVRQFRKSFYLKFNLRCLIQSLEILTILS